MLPKLYLPSTPDPCTLLCLRILLENIGKCSLDDVLAQKAVAKFKAKVFKQLSKQLKSLDVREHADDSQYLDIRRIVQTRSPSPEPSSDRDTDDESEEEERPSRGRKISPMKPSVRRKARSTSLEISDDVHDASPSRSVGPPLSRTPSPSPSSSLLPTPSPGVSMIRHREDNKFKVLPFKASKKMRTTGPQRDTEFKRHRLPVTKPIVAGKARAHYLEGDRESAASSGMDVRPNHRRTRGDHVSIVVGSEDSEDSDF
ncbi:hypothetical protein BC835DRAFT_886522 [Cytidiella melzeri]|nr:hypothetical protein BC835DRAFT_886522 [Cytidiella melzeri]